MTKHVILALVLLLLLQGISFAEQQHRISLSEDESQRINIFFGNFSEVGLGSFAKGQIKDESLIRFALKHIKYNWEWRNIHSRGKFVIPSEYVDIVTNKYFGIIVDNHHSFDGYSFENGNYVFGWYIEGFLPFSWIQDLYDNDDGTYTAIVDEYIDNDIRQEDIKSLYENEDGTYTVVLNVRDNQGTEIKTIAHLLNEYKATIKSVYDGDNKRYILLDYVKTHKFTFVQNGRIYYLPRDKGIVIN